MDKIIFPDWFEELPQIIQHQLLYGAQQPYINVKHLSHLSPDEIRVAATDPRFPGMLLLVPLDEKALVEEELRKLVRIAGREREMWTRDKSSEELTLRQI